MITLTRSVPGELLLRTIPLPVVFFAIVASLPLVRVLDERLSPGGDQ